MEDCGREGGRGNGTAGGARGVVFLRCEDDDCMRVVRGGRRRSRAESDSSFCRRLHSYPARAPRRPTSCPQPLPTSPALPAHTPIYESVIRERYALLVPRPPPPPSRLFLYPMPFPFITLACMHICTPYPGAQCSVPASPLSVASTLCFAGDCRALPRSLSYLNYRSIALRFAAAAD